MICKMCGKDNADDALFCTGCGSSFAEAAPEEPSALPLPSEPPKIRSYMTAAVLTTIFLGNWILGIPAIVFSRECELAWKNEQYEIAKRFSRRALTFMCIGSALSLAAAAFFALVMLVLGEALPSLMY
ncbi:MAG: CD225/dispanin family protein [Clostridia bacterium]